MTSAIAALISLFLAGVGAQSAPTLVEQCRATETAMPASCGCTVDRSRSAGATDDQLASLFRDDGEARPVPQSVYERFWMIKIQCMGRATRAALPLPGAVIAAGSGPAPDAVEPAVARAAVSPSSTGVSPSAALSTPIPLTLERPTGPERYERLFYFTPDQMRAMLAALEGTTWRRTFEDGSMATYRFLPERVIVQEGRNYTNRYDAVLSDDPSFNPEQDAGIQSTPDGLFRFGAPKAPPYLTLLDERGRQDEFWLGYWGGDKAYVGYTYRASQFYAVDELTLIAGTPQPFDPRTVAPPALQADPSRPLADRIGVFAQYPGELGDPGGCDTTIFRPSATVRTARQFADTDPSRTPIYVAENMLSEFRTVAVIRIDGRSLRLERVSGPGLRWRGADIQVVYEPTDIYAPENNGVGHSAGVMTVTLGEETARLPALGLSVC